MFCFYCLGPSSDIIIRKLARVLIALITIILLLAVSFLGIAFLGINHSSIIVAMKGLADALINLIKSGVEILVGFMLGLLIGVTR